jgi:hypothetical protein
MLKASCHISALCVAALAATAAQPTHIERLSASQKQAFVAAVLATDQLHIEEQLPRKLAPLHAFKPYFDMYELASTAYFVVLESPRDTSRWRALAKIAAWADGEYAISYAAARRKALDRNPHLFSFCPEFQKWVDAAQRGQNI